MDEHGYDAAAMTRQLTNDILYEVSRAVVGKTDTALKMLICLLAGGHVLLEDVPGIGKTTLINALARAVDLDFRRIQFTPDLTPSDVTGFNMYNPKTSEFEFQEGAINTQVLLADEINRSSPRTQSALLEAMQEGQVTVEGVTYLLPDPFIVMATQNPVEHVGTYPLPEAQLDRFMMRLSIGYPSMEEEKLILDGNALRDMDLVVNPVADADQILAIRDEVENVGCSDEVKTYLLTICRKTRENEWVSLGVSPRASRMLLHASATLALMKGRDYVVPDDIQALVGDVLAHRIILKPQARGQGITAQDVLKEIIESTAAPR